MSTDFITTRRSICRQCEHAVGCLSYPDRKCNCDVDGVDLKSRTSLPVAKCPLGKWTDVPTPKPSRILPPGTWLSMFIQVITFGLVRPCTSCKSRMATMNRAGWAGLPRVWWRWLLHKILVA